MSISQETKAHNLSSNPATVQSNRAEEASREINSATVVSPKTSKTQITRIESNSKLGTNGASRFNYHSTKHQRNSTPTRTFERVA